MLGRKPFNDVTAFQNIIRSPRSKVIPLHSKPTKGSVGNGNIIDLQKQHLDDYRNITKTKSDLENLKVRFYFLQQEKSTATKLANTKTDEIRELKRQLSNSHSELFSANQEKSLVTEELMGVRKELAGVFEEMTVERKKFEKKIEDNFKVQLRKIEEKLKGSTSKDKSVNDFDRKKKLEELQIRLEECEKDSEKKLKELGKSLAKKHEQEVDDLKEKVRIQEENHETQLEKYGEQMRTKEEKIESLDMQLKEAETLNKQRIFEYEKLLREKDNTKEQDIDDKIEKLQNHVKMIQEQQREKFEDQVAKLKDENREYVRMLKEARKGKEKAERENKTLERKVEKMGVECVELLEKMKEMQRCRELDAAKFKKKLNNANMKTRMNQNEHQIKEAKFRSDVKGLKMRSEEVGSENVTLKKKITCLMQTLSKERETKMKSNSNLQKLMCSYNKELGVLEKDKEDIILEREDLYRALEEMKRESEEMVKIYELKIDMLEKENEKNARMLRDEKGKHYLTINRLLECRSIIKKLSVQLGE